MVSKYITWGALDSCDMSCLQFSSCIVVKDFGPYSENQQLRCVAFDFESGYIHVYASDESANTGVADWTGKLELTIGETAEWCDDSGEAE